jgi:hypothetical protein
MEQSPSWEANSYTASQIPRLLWNPKFHYHVHSGPPVLPMLSQMNLIHTITPYFFMIHFSIILSSTPSCLKCPADL